MAWQIFPRANYVIVWWRKNDNWGYVLAGDWEWEGIQRMGSQRGTDSSLTGKLRNQIGLLSPSLFLQPGKDLLGCVNIVLCFFMVFAKEAFQDMGRRMLMPYPDIQSQWLPNFPISEHSSTVQKSRFGTLGNIISFLNPGMWTLMFLPVVPKPLWIP